MKKFHISDILSVITGKMVSTRNVEGLYDILNYTTKDDLHTHQLIRALDECQPHLVKQFPTFASIDVSGLNDDNLLATFEKIEAEYGSYFEVDCLPEGAHQKINPIAEYFMLTEEK